MRKIAIIAVDNKVNEDYLVAILTKSGHETITIKPKAGLIKKKLEEIGGRRGQWELRCFIEKRIADYVRSVGNFLGLCIETNEIVGNVEMLARTILEEIWEGGDDEQYGLD